jgi:thiol-disulfide isomerase/thioredoxin
VLFTLAGCDRPDSKPGPQDLNELQGHWLVINYWAVWCKPCIEEIPELNRFAEQHAGQVKVFGVNFDNSSGALLQEQVETLQIQFPTLEYDPAVQLGYPRPNVLPTTVVINPQGQVHRILKGPQTLDSLTEALR